MIKLLFVCTHNACRSILAEAITRQHAGDNVQVASAGSAPRGEVHPLTLNYLASHGYQTEGLGSKSWHDLPEFGPDVVITVCDSAQGEACPVWLGDAQRLHWGVSDPTAIKNDDEAIERAFSEVMAFFERRIALLAGAENREALMSRLLTISETD